MIQSTKILTKVVKRNCDIQMNLNQVGVCRRLLAAAAQCVSVFSLVLSRCQVLLHFDAKKNEFILNSLTVHLVFTYGSGVVLTNCNQVTKTH